MICFLFLGYIEVAVVAISVVVVDHYFGSNDNSDSDQRIAIFDFSMIIKTGSRLK